MSTNFLNDLSYYDYNLPEELIASTPLEKRGQSRLLIYDCKTNQVSHTYFNQLDQYLGLGNQLISNNSQVYKSRLFGEKSSGGKAEIFILSLVGNENRYQALIKASGKRKVGEIFFLAQNVSVKIESIDLIQSIFHVSFKNLASSLEDYLSVNGQTPLPPYIQRKAEKEDQDRYQTVYGKHLGSCAAPTAGLHFDNDLMQRIENKTQRSWAHVTLHIGLGTFRPLKTLNISQHTMHTENYFVQENDWRIIQEAPMQKRILVGTTTLRVLESIESNLDHFTPSQMYSTNIFINPQTWSKRNYGGLITNFHLPKSSLFILICSLVGPDKAKELYSIAIDLRYRFFSYGDGMFIKF